MSKRTRSVIVLAALACARCATTGQGAMDAAPVVLDGASGDSDPSDATPDATPDTSDDAAVVDASAMDAGPIRVAASFDVQGHRGARGLRPENTLPSFERALTVGVDTLETDLHFSSDDALIVWHDATIDERLCRIDPRAQAPLPPAPSTRPRIRSLAAAQLRKYRCDLVSGAEQRAESELVSGDDYHLLELSELFDFVVRYSSDPRVPEAQRTRAARIRFDVETKRSLDDPTAIDDGFDGTQPGPFERALVALIRARGLEDRVIVQSFDGRSLRAVRMLSSSITTSFLTVGAETPDNVRATGAAIWSPSGGFAMRNAVTAAHRAGLRVIPWTINDPTQFRVLLGNEVDGVITDRPDLMLRLITR